MTPFGKFDSAQAISESVTAISRGTVCHWCKNSNKIITKSMIGNSNFLQDYDHGKTFKEIGFYMETK
jgi:hypothetical protein